jgi:uncharacterized cupin superfamily protein
MNEAVVKDTETGRVVEGAGWFVLNLAEARWERDSVHGVYCALEAPDARFPQYGVNVHVIAPGQPSARYHAESDQEGFLILAGECIAVIEGQERRLRQWDFVHCPPGTAHAFIGAGEGPCAILMTGARSPDNRAHYPADPVAARYGASAARSTDSSKEAYGDQVHTVTHERAPWPPATAA